MDIRICFSEKINRIDKPLFRVGKQRQHKLLISEMKKQATIPTLWL